jgi:3-hydroxyisobutyrate dehydrogenase
MKTLGWIGLGQMGIPMVKNLLKAGYTVNVYNRTREKTEMVSDAGAVPLDSPMAVAERSDIVFLMLSNADAVRDVFTMDRGLLQGIRPGTVIIDMGTVSPMDTLDFSRLADEKGGTYFDAPVSGSVGAAESAQLIILAGRDAGDLHEWHPYFQVLGRLTLPFGGTGKGSSAKLAINLLLGITGQAIAETLVFAERAGLDRDTVMDLISSSGMNTGLFQAKKEMYRRRAFPPSFMLGLMVKDLGLIDGETERLALDLPLAGTTRATYRSAAERGMAGLDMAAVYLEISERNADRGDGAGA